MTDMPPQEAAQREVRELLTWRVFPASSHPLKAVFVSVVIVLLSLGSAWYAGKALGVLAFFLLLGSLWPFFMPTTYRLTTWGIEQLRWPTKQKRPWTYFRRFTVDNRGILVSPFVSPSRLDPFRGMYILTGKERADIIDTIGEMVGVDQGEA